MNIIYDIYLKKIQIEFIVHEMFYSNDEILRRDLTGFNLLSFILLNNAR